MFQRSCSKRFIASMILGWSLLSGVNMFAQFQYEDGITALMAAARDGEQSAFNKALKKTPDINAQDIYGWTALTYAAVRGDKQMVKKLLSKGADPNIVDGDGRSILMHAVEYGREDIVSLLIDNKADLDHRDKKEATPMGLAWARAKDRIVVLLEKAGAAPLRTEDKRADIYSPLPPHNGPFLLNFRPLMDSMMPFVSPGVHEWKLKLLVGVDGTVRKVRVLIGLPNGGTAAAIKNAYTSRYQPATKNGQPVEVWTDGGATIRRTF